MSYPHFRVSHELGRKVSFTVDKRANMSSYSWPTIEMKDIEADKLQTRVAGAQTLPNPKTDSMMQVPLRL